MKTREEFSGQNLDVHPNSKAIGIAPPGDLEFRRFKLGSDEFLALSFSIPDVQPSSELAVLLTPTEQEVCSLILAGRSNSEIARMRGTSPRTIANQVAAIYRKLGIGSRRELRAYKYSER